MGYYTSYTCGFVRRSDPLFKKLGLERPEVIYNYFVGSDLKYIYLPAVIRHNKFKSEAYQIIGGTTNQVTNPGIILALAKPELQKFAMACRNAVAAIQKKIEESISRGTPVKVFIPKFGALSLYVIFKQFLGVNWDEHVRLIDYSSGFFQNMKLNMKAAFLQELEPVFQGKLSGITIIILDELVSGSSVDGIFQDFKSVLDTGIGIKLREERDYLEKDLLRHLPGFFIPYGRSVALHPNYMTDFMDLYESMNISRSSRARLLRQSKNPDADRAIFFGVYAEELTAMLKSFQVNYYRYLNNTEKPVFDACKREIETSIEIVRRFTARGWFQPHRCECFPPH